MCALPHFQSVLYLFCKNDDDDYFSGDGGDIQDSNDDDVDSGSDDGGDIQDSDNDDEDDDDCSDDGGDIQDRGGTNSNFLPAGTRHSKQHEYHEDEDED